MTFKLRLIDIMSATITSIGGKPNIVSWPQTILSLKTTTKKNYKKVYNAYFKLS